MGMVNYRQQVLILAGLAIFGIAFTTILWWHMLGHHKEISILARYVITIITFVGLGSPIIYQTLMSLKLTKTATVDSLTGLFNRTSFTEKFRELIDICEKRQKKFHLLMIDLNKFKHINDSLGHNVGDAVLQEVAARLLDSVRKEDVVARLGGDEFAILISDFDNIHSYETVIDKIGKNMSKPALLEGHHLYLGASIGVSTYPDTTRSTIELMRCADIAMYMSKRMQKDYVVYNESQDTTFSKDSLDLIGELKIALEKGECDLWLQPKKNLVTKKIDSAECLIRWNHPTRGLIQPDMFIALAEAAGLIKSVTLFVIKQATAHYKTLKAAGHDISLSVNISPIDVVDPSTMPTIVKYVDKARMPAELFYLEITETAMAHDQDETAKVLTALNSLGFQISIDDFGTGQASLTYLKKFPMDEVKLDKSFITDISTNSDSYSIVKSTIDLTHNLHAHVVAEGVEDENTEIILTSMGCDYIQGYYISPPLAMLDFIVWLDDYNARTL